MTLTWSDLLLGSRPVHVFAEPILALRLSLKSEVAKMSSLFDPAPEDSPALVSVYLLRPMVASAVRVTQLLEAQSSHPRDHHVFFCPTRSLMAVHIVQVYTIPFS